MFEKDGRSVQHLGLSQIFPKLPVVCASQIWSVSVVPWECQQTARQPKTAAADTKSRGVDLGMDMV